jgi:hypothetical protein
MEKLILWDTYFQSDSSGDGGRRRTAQISEIIQSANFSIHGIDQTTTSRLARYISGVEFLTKYIFRVYPHYSLIGICGDSYLKFKKTLLEYSGLKLMLWEKTNNFVTLTAAQRNGFKVLALPQNLESLVVSQVDQYTRQVLPHSFLNELKYLSKADTVFCISREEQWLLKLYGINADFLPYYPPKNVKENLLKIRDSRCTSKKERFLVLGTAHNPPTREGMMEQLGWFLEISKTMDFVVDVAGYGTEILKGHFNHPSLNVIGSVDLQTLTGLMIGAKAVLVHQKGAVGALTRIPEMLIAGIPVIANSVACRSAFNYSGIYCYDSSSELKALMSQQLETPSILQPPIEAEKRFVDCLKLLTQS